jgi:hypothetical protein
MLGMFMGRDGTAQGAVVQNYQIYSPSSIILLIAIADVPTPTCLGIFTIKIPKVSCLTALYISISRAYSSVRLVPVQNRTRFLISVRDRLPVY